MKGALLSLLSAVTCGYSLTVSLSRASERDHWAYAPLQSPRISEGEDAHPIDRLIERQLNAKGLEAAPDASPATLLRRTTWNLLGIPPSPQELDAYLKASRDDPEGAYNALIERLLQSPHYGERWGRHWLDVVRYADTAGDAADFPVPEAYQYRNYVIRAFNDDKPYDQFIREQIAGDLLEYANDDQRWEQTIATGYLAISRRIGVSPQNLPHITIEDTIDNLGKTFLGLTIGCARCHDHKFDAIPTEDYYALYGFFESTVYPHAGAEHQPHRRDFVYRVGDDEAANRLKTHREELGLWRAREREQLRVYRSFQSEVVADPNLTRAQAWEDLQKVRADLSTVAARFPPMEIAYAVRDGKSVDASVQRNGSPRPRDKGPTIRRGFLQVLGGQKLSNDVSGSGRLQLADWIASEANPLTARVMVNRVWAHHFGQGLVNTPSDFGVRGDPPSLPTLLDFLALEFMENGWSIKHLHRLIMSSQAYRRASRDLEANRALDPDNQYFWRMNRRRLDAEQLRDGVLMIARQLDLTPGGRHPFPHHLTYFYRQHEPFQEIYQSQRRSVYLMQQRLQKNPYLDLFDGPDGNTPIDDRNESITSTQALYFMNSAFAHETADQIAKNLLDEEPHAERTRVQRAYKTIFGRAPTPDEFDRARTFFSELTGSLGQNPHNAWSGFIRGMLSSNEFLFID